MQSLPPVAAAAVSAPEAEVAEALAPRARVAIAAVNGPRQTVIAGAAADVDALCEGCGARPPLPVLPVSHAIPPGRAGAGRFRAGRVERAVRRAAAAPGVQPHGRLNDPAEVTSPYWRCHAQAGASPTACARWPASPDVCIEVGPTPRCCRPWRPRWTRAPARLPTWCRRCAAATTSTSSPNRWAACSWPARAGLAGRLSNRCRPANLPSTLPARAPVVPRAVAPRPWAAHRALAAARAAPCARWCRSNSACAPPPYQPTTRSTAVPSRRPPASWNGAGRQPPGLGEARCTVAIVEPWPSGEEARTVHRRAPA